MLTRSAKSLVAVLAALFLAVPAQAEVRAVSDTHFVIEQVRPASQPLDALWARMIEPSRWWNPSHSWSGDVANMRLDATVGGCWCEALLGGGMVEHGRIIAIDPGNRLLMRADLGPLSGAAVTSKLEWRIDRSDPAAPRVHWRYEVFGAMPMPAATLAPIVDRVLAEQLDRLIRP